MAQRSGKPWSGTNKIPTVHEFMERLDKDKVSRDQEIDSQRKALQHEKVEPHQNRPRQTQGKEVTDPVTGKKVEIADVGKEFMANVDDPMVSMFLFQPCAFLTIHSYLFQTQI